MCKFQVTHTNDLTSLALTCSTMHAVVIPLIYSRFDIVWPDASNSPEPRNGVDALTYGLATLVMREDLFGHNMASDVDPETCACNAYTCTKCGMINHVAKSADQISRPRRLRRGNYFSNFTRKFSLGNGPSDWVQEYLVTKESGKMLGTLICLAIARMPNLESFVWDMPTGILRDIWAALSSLGDHQSPKLSKVWVRFHDNKLALTESGLPFPATPNPFDPYIVNSSMRLSETFAYRRLEWTNYPIEKPNLSTLPSLSSLTVLNIDEISYLDEMSQLIGRSRGKLRELRVGLVTRKIYTSGYTPTSPAVQCFCLGGSLCLLFSAIDGSWDPRSPHYMHKAQKSATDIQSLLSSALSSISLHSTTESAQIPAPTVGSDHLLNSANADSSTVPTGQHNADDAVAIFFQTAEGIPSSVAASGSCATVPATQDAVSATESSGETMQSVSYGGVADSASSAEDVIQTRSVVRSVVDSESDCRLKLTTLELEGCYISMIPFRKTIDFTTLTRLTLLNCWFHDQFWSELSRFYPPSKVRSHTLNTSSASSLLSREVEYPLKLKRIHTNTVTTSLITFLKDAIAPNSLEWLFLQDSAERPSPVTIDAIFKGPIRRHRSSLTKILIDSSTGSDSNRSRLTSAQKWTLGREVLTNLTSGKLMKLRELAINVDYKDWHFLLQRLPNVAQLRSLHVPHILNHIYGSSVSIKELAMGILNVVSLRPELELCYVGISTKCYEILEKKAKSKMGKETSADSPDTNGYYSDDPSDDNNEDEHDANDSNDHGHGNSGHQDPEVAPLHDDSDDDWSSSEDGGPESEAKKVEFKLREILFYDDKISIFRARHARL